MIYRLIAGSAIFCLLTTTTALPAGPEETIATQAAACWSVPRGIEKAEIVFAVTLDDRGDVADIGVETFEPAGELGEATVRSAAKALEMCSPYDVETTSPHMVRMVFEPTTIDPFQVDKP